MRTFFLILVLATYLLFSAKSLFAYNFVDISKSGLFEYVQHYLDLSDVQSSYWYDSYKSTTKTKKRIVKLIRKTPDLSTRKRLYVTYKKVELDYRNQVKKLLTPKQWKKLHYIRNVEISAPFYYVGQPKKAFFHKNGRRHVL